MTTWSGAYADQVIEWERCGPMECATIAAPMDWWNSDVGEISIALARRSAPSDAEGSTLVYGAGGPGASGITALRDMYSRLFSADIRNEFDVVSFDPRGVGASTPINCEADEARERLVYGPWSSTPGSPAFTAELTDATNQVVARCIKNGGELLPYATTAQATMDLELIRVLLGLPELNYLGASYGSYLGASYIQSFPDNVGRFVLDSFPDYSLRPADASVERVGAFEQALYAYLTGCIDPGECENENRLQADIDALEALLDELDNNPLQSPDGRQLTGRLLLTGLQYGLFYKQSWPSITSALDAARNANPSPALRTIDRFLRQGGTSNYLDALLAYSCADQYFGMDDAEARKWKDEATAVAPIFSRYQEVVDSCSSWPVHRDAPPLPISLSSRATVLVASSTGDTTTPYRWSVDLVDRSDSAFLVTREGAGHGAYMNGDTCVDAAVVQYLASGTVEGESSCVSKP